MISPAKAPLAAMTLVLFDDPFLERWIEYYCSILPENHIYIVDLSGGKANFDRSRNINVITFPQVAASDRTQIRQWHLYSQMVSSIVQFFNVVITTRPEELLVADPNLHSSLEDCILSRFEPETAHDAIAPIGMNLIHLPDLEPFELTRTGPILERRSTYCLNASNSKPCIVAGAPVRFSPGGLGSNIKSVPVDPDLFLINLRYADQSWLSSGSKSQKTEFKRLSSQIPTAVTVDHPAYLEEMKKRVKDGRYFRVKRPIDRRLFRLPERFSTLF